MNKCLVKTCRNDQPYVIFSGGCPRSYSDKLTISVIQGDNAHACFDFTSKIIDFFTIDRPVTEKSAQNTSTVYDNPQALLVLLEEEFVAIDLASEGWPQYRLPYLCSVHSSAIICTHYVNAASREFYERLCEYGRLGQDPTEVYSEREWPIQQTAIVTATARSAEEKSNASSAAVNGGDRFDLLLTGHEDGSVRFWDVTNMAMQLVYKLKTADYFQTDSTPLDEAPLDSSNPNGDGDNWPPFRKVVAYKHYYFFYILHANNTE